MNSVEAGTRCWVAGRRTLSLGHCPKLMAILNVTPDSFSDGGKFLGLDSALRQTEKLIAEGADIIDIGGESTRPGGSRASTEIECDRVVPVIEAVSSRFDIAISIDTSKSKVAETAIEAGAEIINDISGLRFEPEIAKIAARSGAGLVLMHLRGNFDSMHDTVEGIDIVNDVVTGLQWSVDAASRGGVPDDRICIDIGIGFGKTHGQTLRLLRRLPEIKSRFPMYPMLVGLSRKSFIGKITGESDPQKRLAGTIAANCVAMLGGADILRVHDVKAAAEAVKVVSAIRMEL